MCLKLQRQVREMEVSRAVARAACPLGTGSEPASWGPLVPLPAPGPCSGLPAQVRANLEVREWERGPGWGALLPAWASSAVSSAVSP